MSLRVSWVYYTQLTLVCSSLMQLISAQQTDSRSTCLGCRLFDFSLKKNEKKEAGFCRYPCQCPDDEVQCDHGVMPVKDGCSCCYMCPRQLGDLCSKKDKCDVSKELFCDNKNENSTGICRGKDKNPCSVDGVIFQDGEKFQPHCSQLCTCQNGFYGCVNQCPQELQKPSELTCHEPKLITVNNKCCKEWTCQKIEASGSLHRGLESENLVNHRHFTKVPPPTSSITPTSLANHHSVSCHEEQTDWSPCPSCGVGLITKHVTLRQNCIKIVKEKLCYIRPCKKQSLFTRVEGGPDKCTPTTRGQNRQKIKYEDCVSVKSYKLKFCTNCMTDKCCYPEKIKTKKIKFQCTDGKIIDFKFVWIKKCRCDVCDKIDQPHEFSPNRFKNYLRVHREKRFIV